jgi:hypothetical protein
MKLSISKELSEDEDVDALLEVLNSQNSDEVSVTLFDTSLDNKFADKGAVNVGFEDRKTVRGLAIKEAVDKQCQAFLFIPKNCTPFVGMVETLFAPMSKDENITITHSDFSVDGVIVIQNPPICFCRRLESEVDDLYDINKTKGIVQYIPLSLYNVKP